MIGCVVFASIDELSLPHPFRGVFNGPARLFQRGHGDMIQNVDRVKQGHDRSRSQINMLQRLLNDLYAVIQIFRHTAPFRHDQIFRVVKNIDQTVTALILINRQTTRVVESYGFFVGQTIYLQNPVIGIAVVPALSRLSAVATAPGQDGSQQAQNQKKYETVSALPFLSHVCYPFFVLFFSILFFSILFFFIMIPAVAAKSTMTAAIAAYKNAFA